MIAIAKKAPTETAEKGIYIFAVGKRKTVVARVKLYPKGKGEFTVNDRKSKEVFTTQQDLDSVTAPFKICELSEKAYDIEVKVAGGGEHSRAEAIRHGIARNLVKEDESRRPALRKAGFLTRDSRTKERKKPGLKRARRSPQWSKR